VPKAYVAVQITLTTGSTAYSLASLVRAIEADTPGECRQLILEADAANTAGSKISVGDASIGASRYSFQLGPGDARGWDDPGGLVRMSHIYLRGSADGLKVNVGVMN